MMKTKYLFLAALVATMLASCTNDEFVGDLSPDTSQEVADNGIRFGFSMQNATRADIYGNAAAELLGNNFYVTGTKGTEGTNNPSETLVFDNYLVHYGVNTAGTTESNTANWEYGGVTPGTGSYANWVKLATTAQSQTIKYWDYSTAQYDFLAFSTGTKKAVKKTNLTGSGDNQIANDEIGVTEMKYGTGLTSTPAYTFYIPTLEGLKNAYITDITPVVKTNYGNEVQLQFKNLGSKIRIALYETVPGYSIKAESVKFYTTDANDSPSDLAESHSTDAVLISADNANGFAEAGTVEVSFPNIGTNANSNGNKNKASVSVSPVAAATPRLSQTFGTLDNKQTAEGSEAADTIYLGRSLPQATYAGNSAVGYYQVVFPVSDSKPLTLRVDYQLISTDGSGETINVYGAKAVVPATYTVWQPNYAYTYVFKISDNTNGWTSTTNTDPKGLFPITFDAVVQEIKDASGEQTTITTVAMPSITTYQQGHDKTKDEYSIATGKNIYVQVMDNENTTSPSLVGVNPSTKPLLNVDDPYIASKLYSVTTTGTAISEATIMDALQNRTTAITEKDDANLTGRNGITLTKSTNIDNTVTSIENGADDKAITVTDGQAAKIAISSLTAGTYAYVYDYNNATKTETTIYQPMTVSEENIPNGKRYITQATLDGLSTTTTADEDVTANTLYFSKTTTDGTNYTYSFYSVDGKTKLPAGLLKVTVNDTNTPASTGSTAKSTAAFIFDTYIRNTGKYAVKVIKIVE